MACRTVAAWAGASDPASRSTVMSRPAPAIKIEAAVTVQTGDAAMGGPIPEFMLALFHYETIGICLSLRAESELPRRFCDDVARAMGGSIESVRYQSLKLPMLSTSGNAQSIKAAREGVTQKFRQKPAREMVQSLIHNSRSRLAPQFN